MKADELREAYLTFFESKGCIRRPSDVLVPRWDPSVLFTPAGMNQFKDHFLGKCKLEYTRATSCQKCLRAGDIDNVGRTPRHHTFFEMLGNFSFGDYFKREAIHWAWEFLTGKQWLQIAPEKLSVTVYEEDNEAYEIWHNEIGIPAAKITKMGEDDNFWPASAPSQGPDGVCGPCSEIFYQMPDGSDVEIWNLVFTQFNRNGLPPDNLQSLPSKNIDTGMGLERTCALLQGVDSNFHIDILKPLVEAVADICKKEYDAHSDDGRKIRRIADHVRACTFAIHENVLPGNNEEKYVIKRLLRRAVLDGRQMGLHDPFLYQLPGTVAALMKSPYPELSDTVERVAGVIRREEDSFLATIDGGLDRIEKLFSTAATEIVRGSDAAELYTTYGFPPELLETLASERNIDFDWDGFQKAMDEHGQRSGAGSRTELFASGPLDALKETLHGSDFVGYDTLEATCKIVGIIAQEKLCDKISEVGHESTITIILDATPFYGESGGQVGDHGLLQTPTGQFRVNDTQREGGFVLHIGHLLSGSLDLGQAVQATVDSDRRAALRRAHSATHLLHSALQKFLGNHAVQQGSKVDEDVLRFDFSHSEAVGQEILQKIEETVNESVLSAMPVSADLLPLSDARTAGAMMLFGEKYPDIVRVVSMEGLSKELCGGTHVVNTGQIGLVRITGEESVSAGTRRISAVTGFETLSKLRHAEDTLSKSAAALKVPLLELPRRLEALQKEVKNLKKNKPPLVTGASPEKLLADAIQVGDTKIVIAESTGSDANSMRQCIDQLRRKASPIAVLLASANNNKVTLVAGISRELEQRGLSAGQWIKDPAAIVGGKGGGRPDMAQAGGKLTEKIPEALNAAQKLIETMIRA